MKPENYDDIEEIDLVEVFYAVLSRWSVILMADIQVGANLTNDYMVVVKGRPVLEQVIENLELEETYDQLKEKVSVTNETNTRILTISVRDKDIKRAKTIADEIADVASAFISEKMDQDPPTIIQYGYTDTRAVSTSPNRYALYGAMLGFIVSVGAAVLLYLLNDKIMTPEDLEKRTGLNTLATLPLDH